MSDQQPKPEDVRADPGAFTVEQVVAVLAASSPAQVRDVKQKEAAREKPRSGVTEWAPRVDPDDDVEKHDVAGWSERAVLFHGEDGGSASKHAIVGALHDQKPGKLFTQAQVQKALDQFAELTTGGESA